MANTKEQQLAIDMDGSNIIVSAGAGSGKTAVLTQRVIRKIMDGVNVDRLLVLTFTNEAASEMKNRIREAILKNNLTDQLNLLDAAYITTFDSYALSLVKKYGYTLNISKDIGIIDSNIMTIYKYKALDQIFEDMYEIDEFKRLVNDFCLKDDMTLREDILSLSEKLDLELDKEEFLNNYFLKYGNDEFQNEVINKYMKLIDRKINELRDIYLKLIDFSSDSLVKKIDDYLRPLFQGQGQNYQKLILFNTMENIRFTGLAEEGKEFKDRFKKKVEEIKHLLRFSSEEEIKNSFKLANDNIKIILDIIKKLDQKVMAYKDKYGVYEFNDISHMARKIVLTNEDVREEVKNYFNEIMVDEYQDTSNIQEEFVNLISNNNVYMVGDVKQSIYRFRNANPYIFQDKYNKYAQNNGGVKIDLLKNFRSRKETLFNINEIFNLIMDDAIGNANYLESHNMVYGNLAYDNEENSQDFNLEIYNYDSDINLEYTKEEKELFIISEDIKEKMANNYQVFDKKTGLLRPLKYSDICIITDQNKYLDKYKKILEYEEIPAVIYMDLVLTNDTVIMILKNLISFVDMVKREIFDDKFRYLFTSVARSFIFNYDDDKIYHLLKDRKYYDDEIVKKARNISLDNPLEEVINDIFREFLVYERLTNLYDISSYLIRINNFLGIANNLSSLGYNISSFVEYLDDTIKRKLPIKYTMNTKGTEAVKIMNIHKSKGLEFSLCYFTGMHNKFIIKDISERFLYHDDWGIILPFVNPESQELENTILKDLFVDNFLKEEVSEKIRLFYVALTRCREKMIIVTSLDNEREGYNRLVPDNKRMEYRSFLDILNSLTVIDKYVIDKEAKYTHKYDEINLKEITHEKSNVVLIKKEINLPEERLLKKHFSKESRKVLDLETLKAMEYGTSVHASLEFASFKNINNHYLENIFNKLEKNYINKYTEYEFIYQDNEVTYNGVIDLMLEYDEYINIVDYKLKNIDDDGYIKQLKGYQKYIESISNKRVDIYLYSLLDDELKKLI